MTWVKLDDNFPSHPKVLEAGDLAAWMYVCGLCYCGEHLTDGRIPALVVPRLTGLPKAEQLAARLVAVGLWHEVDGGFQIHDYDKKQRSKARVESQREQAKVRANKRRSSSEVRDGFARTDGVTPTELRVQKTDRRTSAVDNWVADYETFGASVAAARYEVVQ